MVRCPLRGAPSCRPYRREVQQWHVRRCNSHDNALILLDYITQLEAELHVFKMSAGIGGL